MLLTNNRRSLTTVLQAFAMICGLGLGAVADAAEKMQFNTGTRAPYTTEDQQGFLDLLIAELFKRVGHEAEVIVYSASARALANANSGIDAGVAMRIKGLEAKYPNLIRVPEKLIDNDFVAYSKGLPLITASWQSLDNYTVGYILGWQVFEKNLPQGVTREKVGDVQQLFSILERGRIELALYERWQGLWRARNEGLTVTLHEPPLAQSEMFIYIHNSYAHLVDRVAEALSEMKRDGSYQAIVAQTLTPLIQKSPVQ
jgi:polar amino acid transport system substrate-binding protein